ncbi:MAG: aminomethyl-transferring glycine dehydrogenase subunit GcvPA [Planctomycetes bacterium]|nr:aminomethyl-transferring glycine dehydrogenase subunit GcvPA [Planctomycetota bacterium]
MDYIQNTDDDRRRMLAAIGVGSVDELFQSVPAQLRLARPLDLPGALSEQELLAHMSALAAKNVTSQTHPGFLGGGGYAHHIPAATEHIALRGEFVTSYTPYQAEASQGTLQAIFEYQTLICELTGLDVANASHYDGSTALAEAAALSLDVSERKRIAISSAVNPQHREVLRTLLRHLDVDVIEIATVDGATPPASVQPAAEGAACVIIQNPNFFGVIEDLQQIGRAAHAAGAMAVASVNPVSMALLKPPGACDFDVAVGDAQPFGIDLSYGGPWCGFMAAKMKFIRQMPGRIAGETVDAAGRRAFCLTLQTREQHIRREKASSNICTNQALMALRATLTMATLGKEGVRAQAATCVQRAHQLEKAVSAIRGVTRPHSAPFFHEFVVELPADVDAVNARLLKRGFIGGLNVSAHYHDLRRGMLLCATERNSAEDVQRFAAALEQSLHEHS